MIQLNNKLQLSWSDMLNLLKPYDKKGKVIYGVPKNGMLLTAFLKNARATYFPHEADLILDDLIESGATRDRFKSKFPHIPFKALIKKKPGDPWIWFPWEREEAPEDAVIRLLQHIKEDPKREGLRDTPKRVLKALTEMTTGYALSPESVLGTVFTEDYDEMVLLRDIEFTSLCEHHMLPFTGTVDVGYIANGKVVGLSKLARLVNVFSQRLQIQERMTQQIAHALTVLKPKGIGVVVKAHHQCMSCRGVKQSNSLMVTSCLLGKMRSNSAARSEFLQLTK